jgi:DNA modification methylase
VASWRIIEGDCVEAIAAMEECSVDAVVCDPPYGLGFMGKQWDTPGKSFVERKAETRNRFDHVGGNHNPSNAADAARTAASENRKAQDWHERWAREALRVLKPGGHLLAFGGTRTYHRLACAVEDAGFEVRDTICWLYGSGFPKSLDVSKAIDARAQVNAETERRITAVGAVIREYRERAGMERAQVSEAVVGTPSGACWNWEHQQLPSLEFWPSIKATLGIPDDFDGLLAGDRSRFIAAERAVVEARIMVQGGGNALHLRVGERREVAADITAPATPEAEQWSGWGTALKPAHEPIVVARKPLAGTVAGNVLAHSTGALNIDGCRVDFHGEADEQESKGKNRHADFGSGARENAVYGEDRRDRGEHGNYDPPGRWPANVALDPEAADMLDAQTGETSFNPAGEFGKRGRKGAVYGGGKGIAATVTEERDVFGYGDSGGASRFFYVAKASRAERNAGLDGFEEKMPHDNAGHVHADGRAWDVPGSHSTARANHHPTVKPIALMRWLVRLVTPPGGTVLDPFTGSGTSGCAAALEGFDFIGIERDPEYVPIAKARIAWWAEHPEGQDVVAALDAEAKRQKVAATGQDDLFSSLTSKDETAPPSSSLTAGNEAA